MKAIFVSVSGKENIERAYKKETREILEQRYQFEEGIYDLETINEKRFQDVEIIFSTWGMLKLTAAEAKQYFPNLKAIFYAAGSVQEFASDFMANGVKIFSAFQANAIPVAEFTIAQIILANKGYFLSQLLYKRGEFDKASRFSRSLPGTWGDRVGIIGVGAVGKKVIELLKPFHLKILVFDPYLPEKDRIAMGVESVSLDKIFSSCLCISNHLANNEKTKGMLDYKYFSQMRENAVFINTGRGAQVVEEDLVRALRESPERTALLDVTYPEPVLPDHPFYKLDNIFISPHIAGSLGDEIGRMGAYMLAASTAFTDKKPLIYEVTEGMLATMA